MAEKDKYEKEQDLAILKLRKEIEKLFADAAKEASLLSNISGLDATLPVTVNLAFKKRLEDILRKFRSNLGIAIVNGVRSAWTLANLKNNELCRMVFGKALDSINERLKSAFFNNHEKALEAFIARREKGLSLSDKVWNYTNQFKEEIETTLSIGIQEGQSAAEIARDLKQYLKYPDKLFRRVRDKETGELHLSKNAKMFHPGAGVNRSSYKNAVRLAATETNIAYRSSDYLRIQDLAFVVGIEVHLSNNHTLNGKPFRDICDELQGKYPKGFKFVGWHPRCYDSLSEVLTNHGWKRFADVSDSDLVFSLNPETRNVEWSGIIARMSWEHKGRMVRFSNRSLDCIVTPEHKMVYVSKSKGDIRTISADEYRQGLGGFYRSSRYKGVEKDTILINGLELPFNAFCEFMGYWLSDGSACRSGQISIAQQDSSPVKGLIVESIKKLGFNPHSNADAITVYSVPLCTYLKGFGKCADKYVPAQIKEASRRQIRIFLDAFLSCDGHIKAPHPFVGNRGNLCVPQGEKLYYTTSEQLAADLGELIVKVGKRPSYRKMNSAGERQQFRNGEYNINYDCYQISECNAATCTVFSKEYIEDYGGMVYDLELATNHIMYVRRRGKCFWGSNCRCFTTTILKTDDELIRDLDGKDRGSVNEVKDVPPQFKEWLEKNEDRIARSEARGKLPYFLRDNLWAWKDGETGAIPVEAIEPAPPSIAERARLRHEARTPEEIERIKIDFAEREAGFSYEMIDNLKEIERFTGIPRGYPMPFGLADRKHANPNFAVNTKYYVNCQTSTLAFEARRRGFDVEARPNEGLSFQMYDWTDRFLTSDGKRVNYDWLQGWMRRNNKKNATDKTRLQYLEEHTQKEGYYEIYCTWKGEGSAHVFGAHRGSDGTLKFFDAQSGKDSIDVKYQISKMGKQMGVIYTDDKILNPKAVAQILFEKTKQGSRGAGISDGLEGGGIISNKAEREMRELFGSLPDKIVREYTAEQVANNKSIALSLGIKKGKDMTFIEADSGANNPNYKPRDKSGYKSNCVECVLSHELRQRGFNVSARAFEEGDAIFEKYSLNPELLWSNKSGGALDIRKINTLGLDADSVMELIDTKSTRDGMRYAIWWDYGMRDGAQTYGHILYMEKVSGKIALYDPQIDAFYSIDAVLKMIDRNEPLKIMRIDKAIINTHDISHLISVN